MHVVMRMCYIDRNVWLYLLSPRRWAICSWHAHRLKLAESYRLRHLRQWETARRSHHHNFFVAWAAASPEWSPTPGTWTVCSQQLRSSSRKSTSRENQSLDHGLLLSLVPEYYVEENPEAGAINSLQRQRGRQNVCERLDGLTFLKVHDAYATLRWHRRSHWLFWCNICVGSSSQCLTSSRQQWVVARLRISARHVSTGEVETQQCIIVRWPADKQLWNDCHQHLIGHSHPSIWTVITRLSRWTRQWWPQHCCYTRAVSLLSSKSVMLLSTRMLDYKLSVHESEMMTLTLRASWKAKTLDSIGITMLFALWF